MNQIKEHMDVVGADGKRIGKVDRVDGQRIKLTKDSSPGGHKDHHHFIDLELVTGVEELFAAIDDLAVLAIDIPIGMTESGPRRWLRTRKPTARMASRL